MNPTECIPPLFEEIIQHGTIIHNFGVEEEYNNYLEDCSFPTAMSPQPDPASSECLAMSTTTSPQPHDETTSASESDTDDSDLAIGESPMITTAQKNATLKNIEKYLEGLYPVINRLKPLIFQDPTRQSGTLTPLKAYCWLCDYARARYGDRLPITRTFLAGVQYFPELIMCHNGAFNILLEGPAMSAVSRVIWGRNSHGIRSLTKFVTNNYEVIKKESVPWAQQEKTRYYYLWKILLMRAAGNTMIEALLTEIKNEKLNLLWLYFFYFAIEFTKLYIGGIKASTINRPIKF